VDHRQISNLTQLANAVFLDDFSKAALNFSTHNATT